MPGRNQARKALARALSRLVLSHETIQRHAQTGLRAPELIEISARASALDLWMAVLQRAEAEASVPALVESVLEENPGAESLRAALQTWSLQDSSTAWAPLSPKQPRERRDSAGTRTARRAPSRVATLLRPGLLIAGGLVLAWRLVYWQVGEPHHSSIERPTAQQAASLRSRARRDAELTDRDLELELLTCWRTSEGGDAQPRAVSVAVRLTKGPPGQDDPTAFSGFSPSLTPRFERCSRAAGTRLLEQMTPGFSISAQLALPAAPGAVAPPESAAER